MTNSQPRRWLSLLLIFVLGLLVGALFSPVRDFLQERQRDLLEFAAGHPLEEESTLLQKIQHDLGIAPWRARRDDGRLVEADYRPVAPAAGLEHYFPESVLELYADSSSPALADIAGMLVKTQADSGMVTPTNCS